MRRRPVLPSAALLAALALSACSTLPRGAAVSNEVLRAASSDTAEFSVYPVTRAVLPMVTSWSGGNGEPAWRWLPRQAGPSSSVLRAGDRVDVMIWDTGDNSLLTAPGQKMTAMPNLEVSPSGEVFIPYVGDVYVGNLTVQAAREEIQERLVSVVPSAQVQLTQTEAGRANSVDLIGGVAQPGTYPLPGRDFSVLGLIGLGGGPHEELSNPRVRLLRDGQAYTASLDRLYEEPALNTTLRGGDQVALVEDERTFVGLGAAGEESLIPFEQDTLSALEAVSLMGGVDDQRGNPEGILILREYPQSAVATDMSGPDQAQVVFTLDLTTADGLFSAGNFPIRPDDLVLATESPVTSTQTILGLFGSAFGVANRAGVN